MIFGDKNKYDLTVLVPGIRTHNWLSLYDSIDKGLASDRTWEVIFIGPHPMPPEVADKKNVRFIEDWGSPIRCQQRGLCEAQGEWITWAADDGGYLPGTLDTSFKLLEDQGYNHNVVIMGKYFEGKNMAQPEFMGGDDYYILHTHPPMKLPHIPSHYYMLNVGIVARDLLYKVGGWSCQFEVCPMSYCDLSIRLQNYGVEYVVQPNPMFACDWTPGIEGDHAPIHYAQTEADEPLFHDIYSSESGVNRIHMDLENWKNAPEKWTRRFK